MRNYKSRFKALKKSTVLKMKIMRLKSKCDWLDDYSPAHWAIKDEPADQLERREEPLRTEAAHPLRKELAEEIAF